MKRLYIDYIVKKLCEKYPTISSETFERIFLRHTEEEVYRYANMISRFGFDAVEAAVNK